MGLAQTLKAGPEVDPRRHCGLADWIATLPGDEADAAGQMLNDPAWTQSALHRAFVREGYQQTLNVVAKHRNRLCACFA